MSSSASSSTSHLRQLAPRQGGPSRSLHQHRAASTKAIKTKTELLGPIEPAPASPTVVEENVTLSDEQLAVLKLVQDGKVSRQPGPCHMPRHS